MAGRAYLAPRKRLLQLKKPACCGRKGRAAAIAAGPAQALLGVLPQFAVAADQAVCGTVVREFRLGGTFDFRNDALRQKFAEFHAPLVERINVPDRALGEDAVLVKRNELAERFGRELVQKNYVGWPIAFEDAMRDEPVRRAFFFHLLGRLAEGESFGLREHICEQHVVVATDWIERLRERDEVARNEFSSLMDQLVERMLAVGSRLAPTNRAGLVVHVSAVERDVLAVALHCQLLQIRREALQVLLVGKHASRVPT